MENLNRRMVSVVALPTFSWIEKLLHPSGRSYNPSPTVKSSRFRWPYNTTAPFQMDEKFPKNPTRWICNTNQNPEWHADKRIALRFCVYATLPHFELSNQPPCPLLLPSPALQTTRKSPPTWEGRKWSGKKMVLEAVVHKENPSQYHFTFDIPRSK